MKKLLATAFLLFALTLSARAQGGILGGSDEEQTVTPKLVADVTSIEPGKTFRLGILYKMAPDWHIYWLTPGDAGLTPEMNFTLPEGFTAGPIQWPVPQRLTLEEIVGYCYAEEVLLFMTVTAPASLPEKIEFSADLKWLACRQECVPGEAKGLKLTLAAGPAKPSAEKALFDKYAALVPKAGSMDLDLKYDGPQTVAPGAEVTATLTLAPKNGAKIDKATVDIDEAYLDLFPIFPAAFEMTHAGKPTITPAGAVFTWTFKAIADAEPSNDPIKVVARAPITTADDKDKTAIGEFELPLKLTTAAAATPAPAAQASPEAATPKLSTQDSAPRTQDSGLSTKPDLPKAGQPIFSFLTEKKDGDDMSFFTLLLYAFLGGLILNVMPCVLPVLSLKVMSFVKQSGEEAGRIWRLGLMFALGVVASFALLAGVVIALQAAGNQVGWGFQMQSPRFVIVMTGVVVALGLSLLGVYEIGLPGSAAGSMDRASRKEGYSGAFFNGVLITALATPCTAPMLGAALGFAFSQPASVIFVFFIAIALGLAAPYVLLAANPRLIKWMPKPGAWMNTFKQFMGFLMMGTAIWLLWILGSEIGADGVVITLAFMLVLGMACWLLGIGHDYSASAQKRRFCTLLAIVLVAGGYWYLPERYINHFNTLAKTDTRTTASTGKIKWEPFTIARVEDLVAQKKLVFLDFTADWCTTCKVNEGGVLSTDRIRDAFAKYNVVPVRGDYTRKDDTITAVLKYFKQAGVPLYIIFPAGRPNDYILLNQILTIGEVEDALAKAAK
ncbi:thioredoxin family protein [bacterium]|nr:thioredoxin family protein [bacterium]